MKNWMRRILAITVSVAMMATSTAFAAERVLVDTDLMGPAGILVSDDGSIYIADQKNNNILSVEEGNATLLAGYTLPNTVYGVPAGGYLDSTAAKALFDGPTDMVEWLGGIVVSDTQNHCIRLIQDGIVQTVAGSGQSGSANGTGIKAKFYLPRGLAVDDSGTLYVADSGNGTIRKITTKGVVSTYASGMEAPCGLAWYDGALYVTDMETHQILKIENGKKTVLCGISQQDEDSWIGGFVDGALNEAQFQNPQDIVVTEDAIYIADSGNGAIRVIRNDRVSTISSLAMQGDSNWPVMPTAIALYGDTLLCADPFAEVMYTVSATVPTFVDGSEDDWWIESATLLADAGVMQGVGNDTFAPNATLTRGMMAALIQKYAQSLDRNAILVGESTFTDVPDTLWSASAIAWLADMGITNGSGNGTFSPESDVTRQDLAVFLYRYTDSLGEDIVTRGELDGFLDGDQVSDYAQEAMEWAVGMGVMAGTPQGNLNPTDSATRAEAATMLCNWMTAIGG